MDAVSVEHLQVRLGKKDAVRNATWTAAAGEITAVMGPNGAGKTTTLRVVLGLASPSSGVVRVFGLPPKDRELRVRVGAMLPSGGFYPAATAQQSLNVIGAAYEHPIPIPELCERVGLTTLRTPYRRMSSGEQRKLAIAAAIIGRPELLIADEPSSGLDPASRQHMWELFLTLRDGGTSVVVTTHSAEEAERLGDSIVLYRNGEVAVQGTLAELLPVDDVLTFDAPRHVDVQSLRDALPIGVSVKQTSLGRYSVQPSTDPAVLATVSAWLSQAALTPRSLVVGQRSLEDLVLELTRDE